MNSDFQAVLDILPFLIPLILLELGLLIFALVDLIKRKRVRGDNKILWAILIIFVSVIGPLLYLILGRQEEVIDSHQD